MNLATLSLTLIRLSTASIGLIMRAASSLLTTAMAGASIVALAAWGASCLAVLLAAPAQAQVQVQTQPAAQAPQTGRATAPASQRVALADPTRPPSSPASTIAPATTNTPSTKVHGINPANRSEPPSAAPVPRLQALHLPHSGNSSALIDGKLLRVGERFHEWTVQVIRAEGVLLAPATSTATSTTQGKGSRLPAAPANTLWLSLLPALSSATPSSP